jgi:DNA-binding response OmpR family regulator
MAKLLIIDDDKDTCEYLKEFFEQRKCVVITAQGGADGLAEVRKGKPDIVLLDIKMEGMNGLEVLQEIKAFDPAIKVIMVTVASDQETRQKAQDLGADDFIKKPLHTSYLEGTVSLKVAALVRERKKN